MCLIMKSLGRAKSGEGFPIIWLKKIIPTLHYVGKYFSQYRPRGILFYFINFSDKTATWDGGLP